MSHETTTNRPWVQWLAQATLVCAVLVVIWLILGAVAPVLAPVLASLLLAYFLDPVIDWFEARKVNRGLAIALVATCTLASLAVILIIVVPTIAAEVSDAAVGLPDVLAAQWERVRELVEQRLDINVEERLMAASERIGTIAQQALSRIAATAVDSVTSLFNALLIPVFTFYFLVDFDELKRRPLVLIPKRYHARLESSAVRMDSAIGDWVRGQFQVAAILALLYAIGLSAIGLRLGFGIGIIAGMLNVVPYLGAAIGIGLSVVMAVIHGDITQLALVGVVFFVVQMLEGYLITPRLVGDKVGMSPVTVMIVLLLGGSLFGFFGLLLAIPAVAAGTVVIKDVIAWYQSTDWFRQGLSAVGERDDKKPTPSAEDSPPRDPHVEP